MTSNHDLQRRTRATRFEIVTKPLAPQGLTLDSEHLQRPVFDGATHRTGAAATPDCVTFESYNLPGR